MAQKKDILNSSRRFYSIAEMAALLGVSRIAIFKKVKSGAIHAEKVGRSYVIPKEEIAAALGQFVSDKRRKEIDESVKRTVKEYGDVLRRLGKE
jgi:excisionase family DNA binding protein